MDYSNVMKAIIITIGDEILIGQTVDTNSAWLGRALNQRGVVIEKIISIRDDATAIHQALDEGFERADVVLMTGGLGPTVDDITKQCLCAYFNTRLVLSEACLARIQAFVESRGHALNTNNRNQARVPEACTVIPNHVGTAPILTFEREGRLLVALPGVPYEMKHAMEHDVLPLLEVRLPLSPIVHKTIMTFGIPEASLAEQLDGWANRLPSTLKLAYLPSPKGVKIRLSVYDTASAGWRQAVDAAVAALKKEIPGHVFSEADEPLEQALFRLLRQKKRTLAVAESCTGGLIGSLLSAIPGASEVFQGGVIAYSDAVKKRLLAVPETVLATCGAVSEETVRGMASGVKTLFQTDCAIAVSGIAGPGGGSAAKPVGTVWVAAGVDGEWAARKHSFGNMRSVNIEKAAYSAMHLLYQLLEKQP